jgi:hypothetical protein
MKTEDYVNIMKRYLDGTESVDEFKRLYIAALKNENEMKGEIIFPLLQRVFSALDCFCDDPDLMDEFDIDEEQLKREVNDSYQKLSGILSL